MGIKYLILVLVLHKIKFSVLELINDPMGVQILFNVFYHQYLKYLGSMQFYFYAYYVYEEIISNK